MHDDREPTEALDALLARMGIRPIAGSAPEGDEVTGGDAAEAGGAGEPAAGVEEGEGAAEAEGDGEAEAGAEGEEKAEGEEGADEGGEEGAAGREGGPRLQERLFDVLDQNKNLLRQIQVLEGRGGDGRDRNGGAAPEVPEGLKEIDTHLRPYMQFMFQPLVQAFRQLERAQTDFADRQEFYGENPGFTKKQRGVIESAAQALRERFGPVTRDDVLYYLRGNPKYAKDFTPQEGAQQRLDRDTVAARRQAGTVAGRRPAAAGQRGGERALDLAKMKREDRIKLFETELSEVAF